jgi:hypothetical protein
LRKATIGFVMSVRLFVRIEKLGSHWKDFHEIWYLSIFRGKKSVEKIQFSLKSDKNNGYFTWRPIRNFDHISLYSNTMRKVSGKICRENQNILFVLKRFPPPKKIVPFTRLGWKILQSRTSQMKIWSREEKPTRCHWMVYSIYNMLNMFRALLCSSSGARDYMYVITAYDVRGLVCWLLEVRYRTPGYAFGMRYVAQTTCPIPNA